MLAVDLLWTAWELKDAHGVSEASAMAGKEAAAAEARGEHENARRWRRIEAELRDMQGQKAT